MVHIKKIFQQNNHTELLRQEVHEQFNEHNQETERRLYKADGQLLLQTLFTYYPNGLLQRTTVKNGQGKLKSSVHLSYNDPGHLVERRFYDAREQLIARHIWHYDQTMELLIEYRKVGKDGKNRFKRKFIYDTSGNLVQEEHYDIQDRLSVSKKFFYDSQGREQSLVIFAGNGQLIARKYTLYNKQNLPLEIDWYNANDQLQRLECFDYADDGTLENEIILDFHASRSFFKNYNPAGQLEYVLRKENGQAVAEEVYVYDDQKRLLSKIRYAVHNAKRRAIEKEVHIYLP